MRIPDTVTQPNLLRLEIVKASIVQDKPSLRPLLPKTAFYALFREESLHKKALLYTPGITKHITDPNAHRQQF